MTIKRLKKIILDENCKNMNKSTVKGFLGELLVKNKLKQEGHNFKHIGNQADVDLELKNSNSRIDVKTSILKREIKNLPEYWGWALKQKSKKRKISSSHLICIALFKDLSIDAFYIIRTKDLKEFQKSPIGRFNKVEKGFMVFPTAKDIKTIKNDQIREHAIYCLDLLKRKIVIKIKINRNLSHALSLVGER